MPPLHIIRRTDKVRQLRTMLADQPIVYISSFFLSGKTVLLEQLAQELTGRVVWYDAGRDDWEAFARQARREAPATLLIDNLQRLPADGTGEKLSALLSTLPEGDRAVVAGRSQMPGCLRRLCAGGLVSVLDKEFVMFSEDEIEQLFLDYGVSLLPSDLSYLKEAFWGCAFAMHMMAQRALRQPGKPLQSMGGEVFRGIQQLLVTEVLPAFPEEERVLLYNLSPFERFSEDMARMVTGRMDAPRLMQDIAEKSYMLRYDGGESYSFFPVVRLALFNEMKNLYSQDYINSQYKRAALHYELQNRIPRAIAYYMQLGDVEKIRELLIRDTHNRPANGDYVELRDAYAMLTEESLLSSPELMKGMCMIESLRGHAQESERWYQALKRFIRSAPTHDFASRTAEEAVAYLDLCLPQRGTRATLNRLVGAARLKALTQSESWRNGFNVAGNSVSLLNGGLDFSRWVPHGWRIYRLLKAPIETALGRGGSGMADIAIAEGELESSLTGDYTLALDKLCAGMARATDDMELRCAAVGIQSRVVAAQGNAPEAAELVDHLIASLPANAPLRLAQNLAVHRLNLDLLSGDTQKALSWLETDAPDETGEFIILDRYRYLLKLRLYVITGRWRDTQLLTALLRHYFESYDRPYMRAQLHLLQAMIDRRTGREEWREEMRAALALARRYHLVRAIADEGIAVVDMLNELDLPDGAWEQGVIRLTRAQAAHYPNFMKPAVSKPVFTDREYQVYSLMIAGYKNAKIASILNITERTVKHYTGEIYRKLGVASRSEALSRAAELGDMR